VLCPVERLGAELVPAFASGAKMRGTDALTPGRGGWTAGEAADGRERGTGAQERGSGGGRRGYLAGFVASRRTFASAARSAFFAAST
jgi:hypothetical protein